MTDFTTVEQLLNDRTYHIEFNTDPNLSGPAFPADRLLPSAMYLTNHAKHAVVALAGLDAPFETIRSYYDNYTALTPYGYHLEPPKASEHVITEENWKHFIGERTSFAGYCDFFDRREREIGLDELVRQYVPRLLDGWPGAFTHATIHLGWALDAGNRWMAIEGLAYLAFCYVSCHPERSAPRHEERSAVDSLLRLAGEWEENHEALAEQFEALVVDTGSEYSDKIHPELAGLQYRIASVLGEGHPLIDRTPSWIEDGDISEIWDQLYYAATLLYLSEPGNFILLHLVTSLHAMEQIAVRLPEDQQRDVVRCYWIGSLAIAFSRAYFSSRSRLAELHEQFRDAVDGGTDVATDAEWEEFVDRAVNQVEEHNPKLVYVMRRMWRRTGRRAVYRVAADHFAPTPEELKS